MVEKMSGNRASNAILKRRAAIDSWPGTETGTQPPVRHPHQFTINFDKGTVFLSAVASGDIEETEKLLKEGVDIDYTNVDGLTALHQACIDENEEMVELLLKSGAYIEARDNEGWTPLHAAASAGNVDIAQILIDNKASLMAVNNEGEVPLDLVEDDEMEEFLEEVIEDQNLDLDQARQEEEDAMLDDAKSWVSKKRVDNEQLDWQGATALHVAAAKNYEEVIKILLQISSIDVNNADEDGWTPLHAAIHWSHKEACELLSKAGADFNIRNSNGSTPCDVADPDFVKFAENLRKQYSTTKSDAIDRKVELENKEFIAVVTSKQPVRSGLKGGRKEHQERGGTSKVATPVTKTIEVTRPTTDSRKITTSTGNSDRSERKTASTISEPRKTIGVSGATTTSREKSRDYQPVSFKTTISTDHNTTDRNTTERPTTDRTSADRKDNTSKTTTSTTSTGRPTRPSSSTYIPTLNNDTGTPNKSTHTNSSGAAGSRSNWLNELSRKTEDNLREDNALPYYSANSTHATSNSRNTDENDPEDTPTPASTTSDSSRVRISDRYKKQTEDLTRTSSINNNRTSITSGKDTSTTPSSYRPSSYSTSTKPATRTSTSTSDTGDTKELQRELDQAVQEAEEYKQKYDKLKKEKDDLQKKLEQYKEDIDKMQELKQDNLRLKDENGALIRVISKLSRTPSSSSS